MKRKIRKKPIIIIVIILVVIIGLIIGGIKIYSYYTSNEYKLGKLGYSEKEISTLVKADDKVLSTALEGYDEYLIPLTSEEYFLWKNYDTYKEYITELLEETNDIDYEYVVTMVNVKRNYDYYTNTEVTDMDKDTAILVNKYYSLSEQYAPDDLVDVSSWYCYGEIQIRSEVYDAFIEMFNAAKEDGVTLIINSGYRSYEDQSSIYEQYKASNGQDYADSYAARPDYSEHQSGLALDIITYNTSGEDFENTEAFAWLSENAYKYGFILRYPEGKEDITGYSYESWHYRYLGKELAEEVYNSGLTYDEYYAYYLDEE